MNIKEILTNTVLGPPSTIIPVHHHRDAGVHLISDERLDPSPHPWRQWADGERSLSMEVKSRELSSKHLHRIEEAGIVERIREKALKKWQETARELAVRNLTAATDTSGGKTLVLGAGPLTHDQVNARLVEKLALSTHNVFPIGVADEAHIKHYFCKYEYTLDHRRIEYFTAKNPYIHARNRRKNIRRK